MYKRGKELEARTHLSEAAPLLRRAFGQGTPPRPKAS